MARGLSQELHGLLWFHPGILMNSVHPLAATAPPALLVKPWYGTNMIGYWPEACSYIFVSGVYLYQLYQSNTPLYVNTKAILGHFLAVSWIWIAHGMLIPAQSVTFDLDCLLPFTLAITYALSRVWRNAKAALKRLRHVEATVSCYTIQGITLQCIWCLMMLKTKATLVTVPCFGSKELPIEWKSWNCDEPPPPTRGGVGDKELQGPGARVGWEGWGTSESGVA